MISKPSSLSELHAAASTALSQVAGHAAAQQPVERKGITSTIKVDQVVSGYITELNGKYRLRATDSVYAPGASVGAHHHLGPGIRCMISGERSDVSEGKPIVRKAGDCWFASGDTTNAATNKGSEPVRVINFEILPADVKGGSLIPPKAH